MTYSFQIRRQLPLFLAILVASLMFTGCANPPTLSPPSSPTPLVATPVPPAVLSSPLATPGGRTPAAPATPAVAPAAATPPPFAVATPSAGRGNVSGRAVQPIGRTGHPSFTVSGELYLGTFVPAADPKFPPAIAVSPGEAPHAVIDQPTGAFVFSNVPPGLYALVMIGFGESFVFEKPNGGGRIEVRVDANKTTELGDVTLR